jgi:hypothetical protein
LRQRKDKSEGKSYPVPRMNETLNISEANVASILQQWPQTNRVFLNQKTACVGCYLSRFCTLKDVITAYQLNERIFLAEVEQSLKQSTSTLIRSSI